MTTTAMGLYQDEDRFPPPGGFPPLRRESETDPLPLIDHLPGKMNEAEGETVVLPLVDHMLGTVNEAFSLASRQVNEGFSPITFKVFVEVSPSSKRSAKAIQSGSVSSSSDSSPAERMTVFIVPE